jgi:hypothetical protein
MLKGLARLYGRCSGINNQIVSAAFVPRYL